ncbi:MAG TPA: hypothetical protein VHX20_16605 [Terracidiphilus sp.]|nr:hypothetical protein [Terracidiphilus sp.]
MPPNPVSDPVPSPLPKPDPVPGPLPGPGANPLPDPMPDPGPAALPTPPAQFRTALASFFAAFKLPMVRYVGIGCLTVLAIVSITVYAVSRYSVAGPQSAASFIRNLSPIPAPNSSASIAKPSPMGRAPSPATVPTPAPAAQPNRARPATTATTIALPAPSPQPAVAMVVPPPAVPPVQRAAPSLPFGVRMSADRDGFSNGCKHGELVMETSSVTFTCPTDPGKSVAVRAAQVKDLDNNGILVFPDRKYHFDISGRQRHDVRNLFAEWLRNARRESSAQASN